MKNKLLVLAFVVVLCLPVLADGDPNPLCGPPQRICKPLGGGVR